MYLFPGIIIAIPLFVGFSALGIRESLLGLGIVYIAQTVPVSVHMLRGHLSAIPVSVEEAAMLDGAAPLRSCAASFPLADALDHVHGAVRFMIAWNEFLFALLFLTADRDLWTVSLGLSQLSNGIEVSKTVLMAGSRAAHHSDHRALRYRRATLTEGLTSGADKG